MNFRELYDEHFAFVWRSMRRLGVREADVADAVQDVFLIVYRRLSEFEGRSKMSTWIFGICYRVASDRRKAARIIPWGSADEPLLNALDERVDVAAEAERRQGLRRLETILDEMSFEQRAVFMLFELECLTGEEIAQTLDVPLGTVYSRLRLARDIFRRAATRLQAADRIPMQSPMVAESKQSVRSAGGKS